MAYSPLDFMKNEKLAAAAIIAAALALESGCSSPQPAVCRIFDPATGITRELTVDPEATCPPSASSRTAAHGAHGGTPGWYYYGGQPYYGVIRNGGRPASAKEATELQAFEHNLERSLDDTNRASVETARSGSDEDEHGFGESGAHGSGG